MLQERKSLAFWIVAGTSIGIIITVILYGLLAHFVEISGNHLQFIITLIILDKKVNFDLILPFNTEIVNIIPSIVIVSIITIVSIFFMIISLAFNFRKKFSDYIVDKWIINTPEVGSYFGIQIGFVLALSAVLLNFYDMYWACVFLIDLIISISLTLWFFLWFLIRSNKKGLFKELQKNIEETYVTDTKSHLENKLNRISEIEVKESGNYYQINFKKQEGKNKNLPKATESKHNTPTEAIITDKVIKEKIIFAPSNAIVKIDENKMVRIIKQFKETEDIVNIILIKNNQYTRRSNPTHIIHITDEFEKSEKINQLLEQLFEATEFIDFKDIEALSDWLQIVSQSRENDPNELEQDFEFLKNISINSINKNPSLFYTILDILEQNFDENLSNNEKMMQQTIGLIYSLKKEFTKNLQMLRYVQQKFYTMLQNYALTLDKNFSRRYATAGLYIAEFIRFEILKNFESEKNIDVIQVYKSALLENIDIGFRLLETDLFLFFKQPKHYEIYLKDHIQQFISTLQFYSEDPYHYDKNYYKQADSEKQVIDAKCQVVKETKQVLKSRITELCYRMFYLIENKKLTKNLKELVFDLMQYSNIYAELDSAPFWSLEHKLHPEGAFTVPKLPKERYILFYLFYQKVKEMPFSLPKPVFENLHLIEELKKELESLTSETVSNWIKINDEEFSNTKSELESILNDAIKKAEEDEKNRIINAKLDNNKIQKFKETVIKEWEENSTVRDLFKKAKNYLEKINTNPKKDSDKFFGFYTLFEKSYFIKNPPVPWGGDIGTDYGRNLARAENENIIKQIIKQKQLPALYTDLENSITNLLKKFKAKKDLIIIVDSEKSSELYKCKAFIPKYAKDFKFNKKVKGYSFSGVFKNKGHYFPIYQFSNINCILALDFRKIGKLVQYNAFGKTKQAIYISVEELDKKDINKLNKKIKNPKTKIKIRIAEKYRIENINSNAFEGYKLR